MLCCILNIGQKRIKFMNTKLVSVITVVYNDVSHIEKTISNVLKQTYPFLEYIVVDGASTDGTLDVIKKYDGKLKYVSEPDKGIYDAMQKGAQLASGEWILFRNCGDFFFSPDAIEKVFNGYVDKGEDFILCNSRYFQDYGYKDMKPNILTKSYFETMPVNHPATFIRRATQLKYPFKLKYRNSADYCFFIEAFLHEATYIYKDVIVALFDNNSGASTDNYDKSISENIDILKTFNAPSNLIKQLEEDLITCRRRKFIKKYIPFFSLYHNYNMKKMGWVKSPLEKTLANI